MRRKLIAGNWKMHLNTSQSSLLLHRLQERIKIHRDVEVVLIPNMLVLQPLSMQIDRRKFRLGAQNAYHQDEGAYTGEVSMTMINDIVHYVLVGHSERRHVFGETFDEITKKMSAAFRNDIIPILCVGETRHERNEGETKQVLHDQITTALRDLTSDEVAKVVIAYEPVWAISHGDDFEHHETPTPDLVTDVIESIKSNIAHLYGKKAAESIRYLYGGSTNADNARTYLDTPGVDGLLPGGASLNYHQFADIIEAAFKSTQKE